MTGPEQEQEATRAVVAYAIKRMNEEFTKLVEELEVRLRVVFAGRLDVNVALEAMSVALVAAQALFLAATYRLSPAVTKELVLAAAVLATQIRAKGNAELAATQPPGRA